MKVGCGAWIRGSAVAGCLLLALPLCLVQNAAAQSSASSARTVLVEKARAAESRGRPDLAVQLWQQILLADPNNAEALAGLARDYKLMGNADRASQTLDRLRRVNPNDPNIARIESLSSTQTQSEQLRRAGELARQGRADEAVRIYRQIYGNNPPDNEIGMAYYQTLYATVNGKSSAVAGMRGLVQGHPDNARFAIGLGTMLTYDPRTRPEGIHILQAYPKDVDAASALRQALIWNASNPSTAGQLRQYLRAHPEDAEIANSLRINERALARMNSGIARTAVERRAFAALNAHRLDEAQTRFDALLRQHPNNGRVLAGMGFLRMQQRDFAAAISFLSRAEENGYKAKSVENALATSRFWDVMGEATEAFNQNQLDVAQARYKAALVMNARSPEALNGLAGVLIKQQQYAAAAGVYEQLVGVQPVGEDGWRGLFLAYASDKQYQKAMATTARFPERVKTALAKDPEYLRTLASLYEAENRSADAERVLAQALALPFPNNGSTLQTDTKLQYAGILMQADRYSQAIPLYEQIVKERPENASAWMGLVSAYHELGQDSRAIAEVQKIPPATYQSSLNDPSFLSMLGAIYQQAGQYETAQGLLERAAKIEIAAGGQPSVALQLQLAGIYLMRNNTNQAYAIYQRVIASNPERADAWKGLIGTLLATNRNAEAMSEVQAMPAAVRKQLEGDIEFEQSLAGLYAANGDMKNAAVNMSRVQAYYAKRKTQPPANIEVQNAWLLYNTGNDRALYGTLMRLGGRSDLSVAQREAVQNIWANWSVRRAAEAMDDGNSQRAVDILDAALQAFPNNETVRIAVAGGYARVGRARDALRIFKTISLQGATQGDYEGAIGAALAANDRTQAEVWLRVALERFGRDPAILSLAARYEQARGDNQRAAEYWRAALAAMPASKPADKLAHELVYPDQGAAPRHSSNGADLKQLLNPVYDTPENETRQPEAPYGPDPYDVHAPATRGRASTSPNQGPLPDTQPVLRRIPPAQNAPQQLFQQQSAIRVAGRNSFGAWIVRDAVYHPSRRSVLRSDYGWDEATASPRMLRASYEPAQAPQVRRGWDGSAVPIVQNPSHNMATDAYKGLITSLAGSGHNAEALAELARIPPDARLMLESDIEFVQTLAGVYMAVKDKRRATAYLNRVEGYYAQNNAAAPAGLEIQHAWLLFNGENDVALYPVMRKLDARDDLTADQREQVTSIWSNWAMRRAQADIDGGNVQRGVEILQAAAQTYPDNMDVRRALAGAYAKAGHAEDALALFKNIPLNASSDYEGAIGAAMGANDTNQAHTWLLQALSRFPSNPKILAQAARFEQARGNKKGAAAYWRAALANMPKGASVDSLNGETATVPGVQNSAAPGDIKRLLNPGNQPQPTIVLPPLPSYSGQPPVYSPQTKSEQGTGATQNSAQAAAPPLRITSQPMNDQAARAQALFAAQTDSQLTQGSAVHALPNATVSGTGAQADGAQAQDLQALVRPALPADGNSGQYTDTQYTPSAQEAATGAYSVPRTQPALTPEKPSAAASTETVRRRRRAATTTRRSAQRSAPEQTAAQTAANEPPAPPLSSAPAVQTAPTPEAQPPAQTAAEQATPDAGATDQQLEQQNLPPLRGPWSRRGLRRPMSPRDEALLQLHTIESGYSGWLGGTGLVNYRSGDLGYSQLTALEAPFEASLPLGPFARFTVVAKPVFLDSGQADGTSLISVLKTTTTGTALSTIPQPIGTLAGSNFAPPAQQNAMGIGGEVQLAFPQFAIAGGYTPYGFLVSTFTGRLMWRPGNGPFTFSAVRDSVKDSQLSYAGLRDPAGNTLATQGQIWGGVVYNQGNLQYSHGDAQSGFYFSVGGQYLTGYNVLKNRRIDGDGGAYWRLKTFPEYGTLNVGVNFFAMHYQRNENAFTHGLGGYFSPQGYFLANVPFTYTGHYNTNLHFNLVGGFGVQAFQADKTKLWPLAGDQALEAAQGNPMLPDLTSVGPNYDLRGQMAYQISPHWFAGSFFSANNTRNYSAASFGFSIHYMFRSQPSTASGPTGLFPINGLRPFTVP